MKTTFAIAVILGLLPPAAWADAPGLRCPIKDISAIKYENGSVSKDSWREVKREATPREAGRLAAVEWRNTAALSNNKNLDSDWLGTFTGCLEVSGRPFSEIVMNPASFRHVALRTLRQEADDLKKDSSHKSINGALLAFHKHREALAAIDPVLAGTQTFQQLAFTEAEEKALVEKGIESAEREERNCSEKDLSATLGPVRDQGDIGWCYAYTASELATFRALREGKPRVSSADIGFGYNRKFYRDEAMYSGIDTSGQEGGNIGKALETSVAAGFCSEKDAPSGNFAFGDLKETIDEIERFKLDAMDGRQDPGECLPYVRTLELFPGLEFDDFSEILQAVGDRNLEFFEKLNQKNCHGKRFGLGFGTADVKTIKFEKDGLGKEELVAAIDKQLDRDNISGFEFSMNMLSKSRGGGHAMTVVGRKFDQKEGVCKYLMRNSWGPGCGSNLKKGICAEEHSGHLWISKTEMIRNAWRTTYIE